MSDDKMDRNDPRVQTLARRMFEDYFGDKRYPHATVEEQFEEIVKQGVTQEMLEGVVKAEKMGNGVYFRVNIPIKGEDTTVFTVLYGEPWQTKKDVMNQFSRARMAKTAAQAMKGKK